MARAVTTSEMRAIAAAYLAGTPLKVISEQFGRSTNTIDWVVRKFKLPRRRRPRIRVPKGTLIDWGIIKGEKRCP